MEDTPDDEYLEVTRELFLTVCGIAIGSGFQTGFERGAVITQHFVAASLKQGWVLEGKNCALSHFGLSEEATMCIGWMIGGIMTYKLLFKFGPRKTLRWSNLLVLVGSILMGITRSFNQVYGFLFGKFLVGIYTGIAEGVAPIYLSEIAPLQIRESIIMTYEVVLALSVVIRQTILLTCEWMMPEPIFRLHYLIPVIPALYQVVTLRESYDSPKYMFAVGKRQEAWFASHEVYGDSLGEEHFRNFEEEWDLTRRQPQFNKHTLLYYDGYYKPIKLILMLVILHRFSGMCMMIYYFGFVAQRAGLAVSLIKPALIFYLFVYFLCTVVKAFVAQNKQWEFIMLLAFCWNILSLSLFEIAMTYVVSSIVKLTEFVYHRQFVLISTLTVMNMFAFLLSNALGYGTVLTNLKTELFTSATYPYVASITTTLNAVLYYALDVMQPYYNKKILYPQMLIILYLGLQTSLSYLIVRITNPQNVPVHKVVSTYT